MKNSAEMIASQEEQSQFVKNSVLYKEFLAEREEILKHKWIESEKAGADIGFEKALLDWILKHRSSWRDKRNEGGQGRTNRSLISLLVPLTRSCEVAKEHMTITKSVSTPASDSSVMDARGHSSVRCAGSRTKSSSAILISSAVVLAGIPSRGVEIARRIAALHSSNRENVDRNRRHRCLDASG